MSFIPGECPTLELVELPRQCGQTNAGANRIVNGEHCEDWEHSLHHLNQFWETMRFLAQFWDERNYEILGRSAGETECLAVDCCSGLRQPQHRLSSTYLPSHFWQVLVASSTFNISCVPSWTWWPAPWTETKWLICSQGNSATSADRLLSPTSMWFVSHLLHNLQHCIMIEISTDKNCFHVWRTKVWPLL